MELNRRDPHLGGKTGILNVSSHFGFVFFLTLYRDLVIDGFYQQCWELFISLKDVGG